MKYVDEFRDKKLTDKVARRIREAVDPARAYKIMEVCGTHTNAIFRFGLRDILPENIILISGPGCPVCVTPNAFLDKAIVLSRMKDVIIATFGDMLRIPGSYSSLEKERAAGASVKIVYSSVDALRLAKKNPAKEIVFLGVGFETTAPTVAQSILIAKRDRIKNYSVLCGHKTMPAALKVLVKDEKTAIDALLLPGHVSAVIGVRPYEFLAARYGKRCVITGFEALDIMEAILMIIGQKTPKVDIEYARIVNRFGNALARNSIDTVFEKCHAYWRGIGAVKDSGLKIRKSFAAFDAGLKFKPQAPRARENKNCRCGDVLKGAITPPECGLFAKVCNPANPVGACMVSSEGACRAYYRYNR